METSQYPGLPQALGHGHNAGAMENNDMDIDMDIDLGPIDDSELLQQTPSQPLPSTTLNQKILDTSITSNGNIENISPHKVHIRGLDEFTTHDIQAYSTLNFSLEPPISVEWIDDTSANIVYSSPAIASKAFSSLALTPGNNGFSPSLRLQAAKPYLSHPESNLEIRTALLTDQKRPRAYEASRFYMMHPEHDPRERRRQGRRNSFGQDNYNKRRYSYDEHRRRKKLDGDRSFSPHMYDDDSNASGRGKNRHSGRRNSGSAHSSFSSDGDRNINGERHVRSRRHVDSYRPRRLSRSGLSIRDRSASPGRGHVDRKGGSAQRGLRKRTPPPYQPRNPYPTENQGKELFPIRPTSSAQSARSEKELFPNKLSAVNLKKELFPHKTNMTKHRRSDAFDAADETADLFATGLGLKASFKNTITGSQNELIGDLAKNRTMNYGRLKNPELDSEPSAAEKQEDVGLNIRGASKLKDPEFSIRGSADSGSRSNRFKELFPGKVVGNSGNVGKELFSETLQGRGRRNKAEDMFY